MTNKVHVKKGDTVLVLSGKDRKKMGKVLEVEPNEGKVLVEKINMRVRHVKPRSRNQQGGILKQEGFIDSSNVMLVCNRCNKPTKISKPILDNGQKVRQCKKCGEVIDVLMEEKDI